MNRLPPDWSQPRYWFGQPVQTEYGAGQIVGLSYIRPESRLTRYLPPGWQYAIEVPSSIEPVINLPEQQVSEKRREQ